MELKENLLFEKEFQMLKSKIKKLSITWVHLKKLEIFLKFFLI